MFVSGSCVLAIVSLTACYLTARKAIQFDPMEAFRSN
jgi:ABC-type lipoprotein release transport system permease subunit